MLHRASNLTRCEGLSHGFFTRQGGVSEGIYASLNCGPGSGDDAKAVRENRRRAMEMMQASHAPLCTLYQVHGADVVAVPAPWHDSVRPKADAMVTRQPDMVLGILTADCAPVLFADEQAGVIGAAHAGWKGAVGGVLQNTVAAMEHFGAKIERISAAVGPCIAQGSYEVGEEFVRNLLDINDVNEMFFVQRDARHYFDLPGFVAAQLQQCGLQRIETLAMDTYSNSEEFFSYRRTTHKGEPDYGRQLSAIMLKGKEED